MLVLVIVLGIVGLALYSAFIIGIVALIGQKRSHVIVPTRHIILLSLLSTIILVVVSYAYYDQGNSPPVGNLSLIPLVIGVIYMAIYPTVCKMKQRQKSKQQREPNQPMKPKQRKRKLRLNCPQCGRSLKGATDEMIGDIGVCPKCEAEFTIEQKGENSHAKLTR